MEDIFYFIILCFYLHYRHLCFNTNVVFLCFVFWSSWLLLFFCRLFTQDTILKIIFIVEKFFVLSGWKTWCFNADRTATECYGVPKCRVCGEGELASRARWIGCDGEDRKKLWLLMSLPLHWTQGENKSCPIKDLLVLPSPSGSCFTIELKNWVHVVVFLFGFFFFIW